MSKFLNVERDCPFCGKESSMSVDTLDYSKWQKGLNIQSAFPDMNAFDREVLQSGICYTCQEHTFGRPAPGHEDEWGDEVGECACCGAPIFTKHNTTGDKFQCDSCYITMVLNRDMGTLLEEEYYGESR